MDRRFGISSESPLNLTGSFRPNSAERRPSTIAVRDKVTGKPVQSSIRSTQGNHTFIRKDSSTTSVGVRPDADVMIQISAPGYKTWYYIDPDDPSQPVLRLHARENKTVDAYLEPKPADPAIPER